jgi:4-hydroxyphenylpyruvate dioxygenase
MRRSIATVSLAGTLTEKLHAIAAAGFDGVEIFENDLLTSPLSPEDVRALLADLGLSLELFQPFRDFEAVTPERHRANLRRARHKFALMQRLGADTILVCSNVAGDPVDDDELAAEQLAAMADLAAEHGVRVAYEALAWGRHVSDYEHAWRIVEMADHPALGTCLDSFHILSRGSDPAGIEKIPGEKVFFLQLADAPVLAMDVLQWSRHHRCFPGQGGLDVAGLTAHVLRTGYDGPLSLEVFNDVFRQAPAGRTAVDAYRSLVALEESTALRLDRSGPDGSAVAVRPARVPASDVPTGVAFVELSVPHADALDATLTALGFSRTGQHRSKPVTLWTQGGARLLVNADDRFDGTGLLTLGVESPDPEAAVARATALASPVLPRDRAADEVRLDAVAAPDGTEIFFCRTDRPDHASWTDDFDPEPTVDPGTDRARPAGLVAVDHVALSQPWQFFDEAVLFYRSVLGLEPDDSLEVADPYGLVRSRAVTSPDGSVRLALNVQPARYAVTDAATQHVAFRTHDILATARALQANGAEILRVSGNYYDDLEARFDLAPGFVDDLRDLGLLYDRVGDAEFLQLFTHSAGRLFFEVVQRVHGYDGYGAANAPFRLAAQHEHTAA